jgi:hypothetical protein
LKILSTCVFHYIFESNFNCSGPQGCTSFFSFR